MTTLYFIASWLVCAAGAFWLLQDYLREDVDLPAGEIAIIGTLSVLGGPVSLLLSIAVWCFGRLDRLAFRLPKKKRR